MKLRFWKIFLFLYSSTSIASSVSSSTISSILMGPKYGDKVFVGLETPPESTKASCNTNSEWTYVFDSSTNSGGATLSLVLTAYTMKLNVKVEGSNSCTIHSGVENLDFILLK